MLASIVVNNHNYGRFLRDAIESALAQAYAAVEVIVVDDGSTDDSRTVIASFGDRIIPIYKECGGQASALNAGIARSRGDVVIALDADDMLETDIVERVVGAFEADQRVAWVMFPLEVVDGEGRRTGVIRPAPHVPRRDGDLRRNILDFPFDMARTATSGNAFAARVLKRVLPIPEDIYFSGAGADWYLSPLAGLFGRCVFLDGVGGRYRVHGSNLNWYERPSMTIDLAALRKELRCMQWSSSAIEKFARKLSLGHGQSVLSVSYMATRLVSLKLDPQRHPIDNDSLPRVLGLGIIATLRRWDVRWPMKLMFMAWFVAMCVAPRGLASPLAEVFYFPNRRRPLNAALSRLHARGRPTREATPAGV